MSSEETITGIVVNRKLYSDRRYVDITVRIPYEAPDWENANIIFIPGDPGHYLMRGSSRANADINDQNRYKPDDRWFDNFGNCYDFDQVQSWVVATNSNVAILFDENWEHN